MVDFKSQLRKGIAAHERASAAKQEVSSILEDLTAQIEEYTNGRVGITVKEETSLANTIRAIAAMGSGAPEKLPLKTQFVLVAYDKSSGEAKRLASWTQEPTGYPCTLRFGDANREAYDRKSLEAILGELLSSAETGRIISSIVSKSHKLVEDDSAT
ncbi:hypothetical protein [Rhizobium sp.]|uniref:hypothetical protein n=1 Tax=Rhizobium sp. TaxID=391 RepID=UPI0034C648B3